MPDQHKPAAEGQRLRVSGYERASSMLLALLISLGLAVLVLALIVLSSRVFVPQKAVRVEMAEISNGEGDGGGDGRPTGGTQLENPNEEAVAGVTEVPNDVQENLTAVTEVVVENAAQLDAQLDDPAVVPRKRKGDFGTGGGTGGGDGDGRGLGHGPGKGGIPRLWELQYVKGNTLEVYARQLDFFGIELGVLLPDNKVVYAFNLAKPMPETRTGAADKERRYYLTWRGSGDLQKADRELLARAGIEVADRVILKFLPAAVEAQLAALEKAYAGKEAKDIRKTRFGVKPAGDGYAFYVLEQTHK